MVKSAACTLASSCAILKGKYAIPVSKGKAPPNAPTTKERTPPVVQLLKCFSVGPMLFEFTSSSDVTLNNTNNSGLLCF
jgi:hypothetical protein